jgi:ketosteroid isomerase-like protein
MKVVRVNAVDATGLKPDSGRAEVPADPEFLPAAFKGEVGEDVDNIVREQWQNVWPRIRDFHFEPGAQVQASGDSAWIAGGWLTEVTGADGRPVTRPGRGTFVLERRAGKWLAVHSHFSLLPSQSETAHGRLSSDSARS